MVLELTLDELSSNKENSFSYMTERFKFNPNFSFLLRQIHINNPAPALIFSSGERQKLQSEFK
jgi:hypothetical protein